MKWIKVTSTGKEKDYSIKIINMFNLGNPTLQNIISKHSVQTVSKTINRNINIAEYTESHSRIWPKNTGGT